MTTPSLMQTLLHTLAQDFPGLKFQAGANYVWSPSIKTVFYDANNHDPSRLLHELGHALLGHTSYKLGAELLRLERAAWTKAVELAKEYDHAIDEAHIENALDTYRDWLYWRSKCEACGQAGLEDGKLYRCLNCFKTWVPMAVPIEWSN
jgi:hypothetical protein